MGWESASKLQRLLSSLLTKCFAAGEEETDGSSPSGAFVIDCMWSICISFSILNVKECWLAEVELRWACLLFVSMQKTLLMSTAKLIRSLELDSQFIAWLLVSSVYLTVFDIFFLCFILAYASLYSGNCYWFCWCIGYSWVSTRTKWMQVASYGFHQINMLQMADYTEGKFAKLETCISERLDLYVLWK